MSRNIKLFRHGSMQASSLTALKAKPSLPTEISRPSDEASQANPWQQQSTLSSLRKLKGIDANQTHRVLSLPHKRPNRWIGTEASQPAGDQLPSLYASRIDKSMPSDPETPPPTVRDFIRDERLKLAKPRLIWSKHKDAIEGRTVKYKIKFIDNLLCASKRFSDTVENAGISKNYDTIIAFYRKLKEKVNETKDKEETLERKKRETFSKSPSIKRDCLSYFKNLPADESSNHSPMESLNSKQAKDRTVYQGRSAFKRRSIRLGSSMKPVVLGGGGIMSQELSETAMLGSSGKKCQNFTMQVRLAMKLMPLRDGTNEEKGSIFHKKTRGEMSYSLQVESDDLKMMKQKVMMKKLREDAAIAEKKQVLNLSMLGNKKDIERSRSIKKLKEIRPTNKNVDILGRLGLSTEDVKGFDKSDLYSILYKVKEKIRAEVAGFEKDAKIKSATYCDRVSRYKKRQNIGKERVIIFDKNSNINQIVRSGSFQSSESSNNSTTEKRLGQCYKYLALGCPVNMVKSRMIDSIRRKE